MTDDMQSAPVAEAEVISEAHIEQAEDSAPEEEPKRKGSKSAREALEKAFAGGTETQPTAEEKAAAEAKAEARAETKPDEKAKPEAKPDEKAKPEAKADPKVEPKAEAKPEAKDATPPPARFSADAKAEWEKAPQSVRAEATRMQRELEQGLAEKDKVLKPLEPFVKMAKDHGTTIDKALASYVNMEQLLRSNPAQGLRALAQNMGMHPQQMAQLLTGGQQQKPQGQQPQGTEDQTIRALQHEIQQLRNGMGQVQQTFRQQQETAVLSQVEQFAAQHPRFDELAEEIAQMLKTGYASDLGDAYEKAERLRPPPPAPQPEPTPVAVAQTRAPRSLTGAPSPGSDPTTNRTPSKTPRDALRRAFQGL